MEKILNRFTKTAGLLAFNGVSHLRLFLALGIALASFGCWRAPSPNDTFLQIREEMGRGQLDAALRDVDRASGQQRTNPEWAARFSVLKAHILMLRGSYSESLRLLNEPLPVSLSRSETEVQRRMVRGVVYSYLQQFELSDRAISGAENLADGIHSSFLGDVARSEERRVGKECRSRWSPYH